MQSELETSHQGLNRNVVIMTQNHGSNTKDNDNVLGVRAMVPY